MKFLQRFAAAFKAGLHAVSPTCREASRLQSEALDRPLPWLKRLGLRFHLILCQWCRRYGKQIRFLRDASHENAEQVSEAAPQSLSSDARERLKRAFRDEPK